MLWCKNMASGKRLLGYAAVSSLFGKPEPAETSARSCNKLPVGCGLAAGEGERKNLYNLV